MIVMPVLCSPLWDSREIACMQYPESSWLDDWAGMASRYTGNPWVIAAELRNELRCAVVGGKRICPTWGDENPASDWRAAALRGANAVLGANPCVTCLVAHPAAHGVTVGAPLADTC